MDRRECFQLALAGAAGAVLPAQRLVAEEQVGYLKPKSRRASLLKLRRLLLDLDLTNHDARVLGGILAQIEWKIGQRNSE